MKQFLKKPMGLAVAATLAMGGMAAFTSASADTDANALGDAAIVPYYTTKGNFVTGVQVINTSDVTQAVKIRLRRDSDSADILDFNVIMSPFDHFSGYINKIGDAVTFHTADNSCTAPIKSNGSFTSPVPTRSATAGEGYIEIIAMGQTDGSQPIDAQAVHVGGTPANCLAVQSNFLKANVTSNLLTNETGEAAGQNTWEDSDNVLKVSYFIRDGASGMEMGDNATHIVDFASDPMMTNQEAGKGIENGFTDGFDFPDLDGGGSNGAANRGLYDTVIRADLGSATLLNNWSYNPANAVATDWVINIPGQYLMQDPTDATALGTYSDIPVEAALTFYDREEGSAAGGQVVVSPGIPGGKTSLPNEVNVIEWGGKSVYNSENAISADPASSGITSPFGWASLGLTSANRLGQLAASASPCAGSVTGAPGATGNVIFDLTVQAGTTCAYAANPVPMIGFAAWQRKFEQTEANRNYGRIEAHSRIAPVVLIIE